MAPRDRPPGVSRWAETFAAREAARIKEGRGEWYSNDPSSPFSREFWETRGNVSTDRAAASITNLQVQRSVQSPGREYGQGNSGPLAVQPPYPYLNIGQRAQFPGEAFMNSFIPTSEYPQEAFRAVSTPDQVQSWNTHQNTFYDLPNMTSTAMRAADAIRVNSGGYLEFIDLEKC